MFNSYKIVTVSDSQFELIARGCISAVIVNDPVLPEIQKTEHFILAHGDAAMIARVDRHYPSAITGRVVIEFSLVEPRSHNEQFELTELCVEQLKRSFCPQIWS
ncbi:hypothetical protein [Gilliamella sp. wkB308]|uniref:hypothetical protein n=1 Tax=Gilliamella sp. wkB308 TaxID=3120263 RepID=UPI00080DC01B|nr:hypothetical protein [Gilliamella apicola]OCF98857.1 hypothetical protein A9G10_06420 [Gilliamella apicola]